MTTVTEYLVGQLSNAGVETVYGLPGGENVELLDAIRQQGMDFVLVKNESSACFMAATSARLTGKIGVALTTLGPGATNAYVGLAHAYLDRASVLLLTAQTDPYLIGTHTHQVIDLQACFAPITKFTAELDSDTAVSTIHHALHMATSGRAGPIHLGMNNRVALKEITPLALSGDTQTPIINITETATSIQSTLKDSQRPIIVLGLGLETDKPYSDIQQLAEALNAPVIDTPKIKGALSAEHPLFAGTIGLTRTDPVYELLDESDCILAIGFDVVELVKPWNQKQPLVWIANWENQDPRIPSEVEYVGDLSALLKGLTPSLDYQINKEWGQARVEQFKSSQGAIDLPDAQQGTVLPQDVLSAIRDNTPDDIIITTDVGSHKIFTALNWQARKPNTYFVSNGLSAMGFGLTSAISATHVTGKPSICITGDAGLAMVMGELKLLSDLALPIIVVVMNDSALDLIRSAQKRRGREVFGTEFSNPDYEHIAGAYQVNYRQVNTKQGCASAIRDAIESGQPILIEAMIDPIGYPTTVT